MTNAPHAAGPDAVRVGEDPTYLPPSLRLEMIKRICRGASSRPPFDLSHRLDTVMWVASGGEHGYDWGYR
jgi:hypothetical protein